jgi:hypothetical protein
LQLLCSSVRIAGVGAREGSVRGWDEALVWLASSLDLLRLWRSVASICSPPVRKEQRRLRSILCNLATCSIWNYCSMSSRRYDAMHMTMLVHGIDRVEEWGLPEDRQELKLLAY